MYRIKMHSYQRGAVLSLLHAMIACLDPAQILLAWAPHLVTLRTPAYMALSPHHPGGLYVQDVLVVLETQSREWLPLALLHCVTVLIRCLLAW